MTDLIIFDCDGVLVDSEPLSNRILAEQVTALGLPMTVEASMEAFVGRRMVSPALDGLDPGHRIHGAWTVRNQSPERASAERLAQLEGCRHRVRLEADCTAGAAKPTNIPG